MTKRVKATKTLNPLHFEDLEPHRFEDLIRRLLYNLRDWNDIEPTGRGGSDDGFDIRAWERAETIVNVSEEGEEGVRVFDLGKGDVLYVRKRRPLDPTQKSAMAERAGSHY